MIYRIDYRKWEQLFLKPLSDFHINNVVKSTYARPGDLFRILNLANEVF